MQSHQISALSLRDSRTDELAYSQTELQFELGGTMSKDGTIGSAGSNRKMHAVLSALTVAVGVLLLAYMVTVEGEPGALPLLLILLGSGWYFTTRARFRAQQK
jgi:hypothetical protein